ncbi:hypothetical protein GP486_004106 [Trichoglossum hirsutum]|uniref:Uncharacterized protein n=1 Tax=Trichoglossum hirsutum TaxID=265104 RepID=A0A9P8LC09_9PEZI|nr:hypothetical protein GP486_004106 [Trichoglossum hirsutum]
MNKTLEHHTQPASEEDDTPLVELDVFHQLHCLNSIRNIVYGTNAIMCHGDLTPITHKPRRPGYNPLLPPWQPQFAVPHTCRNFQKIHEWAQRYNTSGYVIEPWPGIDPVAELRLKPEDGKGAA